MKKTSSSDPFCENFESTGIGWINDGGSRSIEFCRNADMLIHDAHYIQEEMVETAGYGHSSYEDAFDLGVQAKVKHLIFFHHEPDRKDDEIELILKHYRKKRDSLKIPMKLDAAKEGLSYVI